LRNRGIVGAVGGRPIFLVAAEETFTF